MSEKHSFKFTYKFWSKDMYPYVYEALKEREENLKRKRKKTKMSEETRRELLSFLNDTYSTGDWNNLIDFIDNNFISKKEIGRTENDK